LREVGEAYRDRRRETGEISWFCDPKGFFQPHAAWHVLAALALAGLNAQIIIANHNAKSGQAAVDNITRLTGNSKVEALQLDLSSFDSVRKVAAAVLAKHQVLDVVINDRRQLLICKCMPVSEGREFKP